MPLSAGNVIALLSLIVAIPCTVILLWKAVKPQQGGSHDFRMSLKTCGFLGFSDNVKVNLPRYSWDHCLVAGLQATWIALAFRWRLGSSLNEAIIRSMVGTWGSGYMMSWFCIVLAGRSSCAHTHRSYSDLQQDFQYEWRSHQVAYVSNHGVPDYEYAWCAY